MTDGKMRVPASFPYRQEILEEAINLITGDRNVQYGNPDADLTRIAALWTIIFEPLLAPGAKFTGPDVARAMIQLKQSRLTWNSGHRDSWVDSAGYAAIGGECAILEREREGEREGEREREREGEGNVATLFRDGVAHARYRADGCQAILESVHVRDPVCCTRVANHEGNHVMSSDVLRMWEQDILDRVEPLSRDVMELWAADRDKEST